VIKAGLTSLPGRLQMWSVWTFPAISFVSGTGRTRRRVDADRVPGRQTRRQTAM